MTKLGALPLIAATIVLNLTLAFALRQGLLACGAGEAIAGWTASTVWSVVALTTLTFAAKRWNRWRQSNATTPSVAGGDGRPRTAA